MLALVSGKGSCRELSCWEREVLSHTPVEGDDFPTPCFVEGCKYAHDPATRAQEYEDLLAKEASLLLDTSKKGKVKFSTWGMTHAWKGPTPHFSVRPGKYGRPLLRHHFKKQILDGLYLAELGIPKTHPSRPA